ASRTKSSSSTRSANLSRRGRNPRSWLLVQTILFLVLPILAMTMAMTSAIPGRDGSGSLDGLVVEAAGEKSASGNGARSGDHGPESRRARLDAPERFAVRRCTGTNQNALNTKAIGELDGFEHPIESIIEDQPIEPIVM